MRVSVIGASAPSDAALEDAQAVGRLLAERGTPSSAAVSAV